MAKVQLSIEELLNMIRGEVNLPETRKNLSKALIEVWNSREMREELEARAEELAQKKMERIIESSFKQGETGWGSHRKITLEGWAAPIIKEELSKQALPQIVQIIKPDVEKLVAELVQQAFGKLLMSGIQPKE